MNRDHLTWRLVPDGREFDVCLDCMRDEISLQGHMFQVCGQTDDGVLSQRRGFPGEKSHEGIL
ncbi:MAG: hypothetical protein A2170_09260 [Deltaproteobacteria bacterium RBG_13_53_10]|nr:MAG: hypothetical protein A2170_09260 [Deltaproteobacteria bacterium RBG_13_53_10]